MNHAIRIHQTGGPEVLKWEETPMPKPGHGEVLIRHTAIGLNFIDTYFRSGLYPMPMPAIIGMEGVGVIEETGADVTDFKKGDRVGYATRPLGAYAMYRTLAADRLIKVPDDISDEIAAAAIEKGMTAEYLLRRTFQIQRGQTILWHAAAGGVGSIACQWAAHLGATVIGTVGSAGKAELAKRNGCTHVINYNTENFVERVREITNRAGVPVVYDSVGKSTFMGSLDCLAPRGMMVSFGNASGPVDPVSPLILTQKGSVFLTRPSLGDYTASTQEYRDSAAALFDVIRSGAVKITVNQRYALKDAAQAHRDLESRKTTGSSILMI
jgi:NADPH2:quinone reductase